MVQMIWTINYNIVIFKYVIVHGFSFYQICNIRSSLKHVAYHVFLIGNVQPLKMLKTAINDLCLYLYFLMWATAASYRSKLPKNSSKFKTNVYISYNDNRIGIFNYLQYFISMLEQNTFKKYQFKLENFEIFLGILF